LEKYSNFKEGENLNVDLQVIAKIETVFDEKFGVPRQPGLIPEASGIMRFKASEDYKQAFHGLEQCSHIWLMTWFHQVDINMVKPRVRPPRLGGDKSLGVFATRSPFRPNPIALSLVELEKISIGPEIIEIKVKGVDLVSGTPVLDIKPYLPYCESIPEAKVDWLELEPEWRKLHVTWSPKAEQDFNELNIDSETKLLVDKVLEQDPRPAYKKSKMDEQFYGIKLKGINIRFSIETDKITVKSMNLDE